jgi:DNA-directed RNA polymerase subunit RPC12/RpoP
VPDETNCAICRSELMLDTTAYDDLDEDTPELVCTGCGSAIISAPLTGRVWWRPKGTKIAPQQRRAA